LFRCAQPHLRRGQVRGHRIGFSVVRVGKYAVEEAKSAIDQRNPDAKIKYAWQFQSPAVFALISAKCT